MTTYNSYQEAKIANPDSEIYKFDKSFTCDSNRFGQSFPLCNPADHCMTVEKFLGDGHKFVGWDVYLNSDGRTLGVVNIPEYNNKRSTIDCNSYILRAAALEEKPSEKVEWVNGDECLYMNSSEVHRFIGVDPTRNEFCYIKANCSAVNWVEVAKLSKPETKQQREDRERLEAAYDLYLAFWSASKSSIILVSYNEFSSRGNSDLKHFLAVVDKTNYRKESK